MRQQTCDFAEVAQSFGDDRSSRRNLTNSRLPLAAPLRQDFTRITPTKIRELLESCSPHEAVFANFDGWTGDCPGHDYIID